MKKTIKNNRLYCIKNDITKKWLLDNGFRYCRSFSDYEIDTYVKRFPVYKYNNETVILEGELRVALGDNRIFLNVFNAGHELEKYAPFYYSEYGNHEKVLEIIWKNFNKVLNKIGIDNKN